MACSYICAILTSLGVCILKLNNFNWKVRSFKSFHIYIFMPDFRHRILDLVSSFRSNAMTV